MKKGYLLQGLIFRGIVIIKKRKHGKINITPFELIPWTLGNFESIEELKEVIYNINLINISFSESMQLTPLHWMISDKKDCIVLEQTKEGLNIYDNAIGVLTNNPPFWYHCANINNYLNLTPKNAQNRFSDKIRLSEYGSGMGAIGLPGDNSSSSRFIRASFNKLNSISEISEEASVSQFFHILDSVAMVKGSNIDKNKYDFTVYSCCINATKGIFYYKTYENNQITAVKMNENNINSKELVIYELERKQQINYCN